MSEVMATTPEIVGSPQRTRRWIPRAIFYYLVFLAFSFVSCGILWGFLAFWVPQFYKIFRDFKTELPTLTMYLMKLSEWVREPLGFVAMLTVILVIPVLPSILVALPETQWKRLASAILVAFMFVFGLFAAFVCIQLAIQLPFIKLVQSVSGGGGE